MARSAVETTQYVPLSVEPSTSEALLEPGLPGSPDQHVDIEAFHQFRREEDVHALVRRREARMVRRQMGTLFVLLACVLVAALLWPTTPEMEVAKTKVNYLYPNIRDFTLDVSMTVTGRIKNDNYFTVNVTDMATNASYVGQFVGTTFRHDPVLLPARSEADVDLSVDFRFSASMAKDIAYQLVTGHCITLSFIGYARVDVMFNDWVLVSDYIESINRTVDPIHGQTPPSSSSADSAAADAARSVVADADDHPLSGWLTDSVPSWPAAWAADALAKSEASASDRSVAMATDVRLELPS